MRSDMPGLAFASTDSLLSGLLSTCEETAAIASHLAQRARQESLRIFLQERAASYVRAAVELRERGGSTAIEEDAGELNLPASDGGTGLHCRRLGSDRVQRADLLPRRAGPRPAKRPARKPAPLDRRRRQRAGTTATASSGVANRAGACTLPDTRYLCVSLHDVAPATWRSCQQVLTAVREVADIPLTLLVVPAHWGRCSALVPGFESAMTDQLTQGHELALHGYFHRDLGVPCSTV